MTVMADTEEKLREFLVQNPILEQGESIHAAAKAMPLGGVKKFAKDRAPMLAGGAIGAFIAHQRDKKVVSGDLETAMRNGVYLLATDQRLFLIAAGGMRGLPQEHLGSVERSRITKVEQGSTRVSLVKMLTVTFSLDDGTELGFEFPKVDTKDGERILRTFGV
jgi:hypothetical protein